MTEISMNMDRSIETSLHDRNQLIPILPTVRHVELGLGSHHSFRYYFCGTHVKCISMRTESDNNAT